MHDHASRGGVDEHDAVGRWRLLDNLLADEVEHEAGMQATLRGERDAGDGAGNVAMDVAEEDMADIAVARQKVEEALLLFPVEWFVSRIVVRLPDRLLENVGDSSVVPFSSCGQAFFSSLDGLRRDETGPSYRRIFQPGRCAAA